MFDQQRNDQYNRKLIPIGALLDVIPRLEDFNETIWTQVTNLVVSKSAAFPQLKWVTDQVLSVLQKTKERIQRPTKNKKQTRGDPKQRTREKPREQIRTDLLHLFKRQSDDKNTAFADQRDHLLSPLPLTLPPEPSIIGVGILLAELPEKIQLLLEAAKGQRRREALTTEPPKDTPLQAAQKQFLNNVKKATKRKQDASQKSKTPKAKKTKTKKTKTPAKQNKKKTNSKQQKRKMPELNETQIRASKEGPITKRRRVPITSVTTAGPTGNPAKSATMVNDDLYCFDF
jgi:hypothetical protein